ncbi:MAG TPA: winged helix-turn-helix domain-containing protein, partial [Candidatus Acidoferrales bacterium]|nr:winged helix-turn-helix domain-containing protein [Candidatus Acidoferrales bacterium]
PADTFVDYDHSLNTAVNKLREALNDSADNPRFIQTIPRRGYRFIAPVEAVAGASSSGTRPAASFDDLDSRRSAAISGQDSEKTEEHSGRRAGSSVHGERRAVVLSDPRELPVVRRATVQLLFSLIQGMYLGFYVASLGGLHRIEALLPQVLPHPTWVFVVLLLIAVVGIPIRLYLLSAALFGYRGLSARFLKLFPVLFPLDELWALAPFLLVSWIGVGLALAATAALLYLPFSQRSLLLMGERDTGRVGTIAHLRK